MPETARHKLLDPKTLNKLSRLELKARSIVEGFISGLHRSPYHGFSVEFAEHREYVAGDDLRYIDWKVFGRSDRFYIKQYEEETNYRCHLLLDTSESMAYGPGGVSKFEYGSMVAAALAYLISKQQDAVGLALFRENLVKQVPPGSSHQHLLQILHELEHAKPDGKTKLGAVLHEVAEKITRKGIVVVLTDAFDDIENVLDGLQHLRHRRHEVVLFHLLDHDELTFPFRDMTRFEGLEALPELLASPQSLKKAYLEALQDFQAKLRKGCRDYNVDYRLLDTSEPLDVALTTYLTARSAVRARSGTVRG